MAQCGGLQRSVPDDLDADFLQLLFQSVGGAVAGTRRVAVEVPLDALHFALLQQCGVLLDLEFDARVAEVERTAVLGFAGDAVGCPAVDIALAELVVDLNAFLFAAELLAEVILCILPGGGVRGAREPPALGVEFVITALDFCFLVFEPLDLTVVFLPFLFELVALLAARRGHVISGLLGFLLCRLNVLVELFHPGVVRSQFLVDLLHSFGFVGRFFCPCLFLVSWLLGGLVGRMLGRLVRRFSGLLVRRGLGFLRSRFLFRRRWRFLLRRRRLLCRLRLGLGRFLCGRVRFFFGWVRLRLRLWLRRVWLWLWFRSVWVGFRLRYVWLRFGLRRMRLGFRRLRLRLRGVRLGFRRMRFGRGRRLRRLEGGRILGCALDGLGSG